MGWVARGGRCLEDRSESAEQAWFTMLRALPRLFSADAGAYSQFAEAGEVAERVRDADAVMFARMCRGYALILDERITDGG